MSGWMDVAKSAPLAPGVNPMAGGAPGGPNIGDWLGDTIFGKKYDANPNAGAFDTTQSDEARAQQMALMAQLQAQAAGQGPSLAQNQLQRATDQNMQQAMSMGLSSQAQGMNPGSALRAASRARASIQGQSAMDSADLRAKEQFAAQSQLGALLGGMRGQDLGQAGGVAGAGLDQQAQAEAIHRRNNPGLAPLISGVAQGVQSFAGMGSKPQGLTQQPQGSTGLMPQTQNPQYGNQTVNSTYGTRGYSAGGPVDSPRNDTVPALLSPGEIVLPRSVAMAEDSPEKAAQFVAAIRARRVGKGHPLSKLAAK